MHARSGQVLEVVLRRWPVLGGGLSSFVAGASLALALGACASTPPPSEEPTYRLVRNDPQQPQQGGLPADKQADVRLVLQQREPTVLKCYQDELNQRQDRSFQGNVTVLIRLAPNAPAGVRILKSSLNSPEVDQCLVKKIEEFEFPEVDQEGEVQNEFVFRPAY